MRIKKTILVFFSTLVLLILGTWVVLRVTGAGHAIINDVLSRVFRSKFGMSEADLDILDGTAEITNFKLEDPDRPEKDLVSIKKVIVGISQNPLDLGALNTLTLSGTSLHIRLGADEAPDLTKIMALAEQGTESTEGEAMALPEIHIEESTCALYLPGAKEASWTFKRIFLALTPEVDEAGIPVFKIKGQFLTPIGPRLEVTGSLTMPPCLPPRIKLRAICPEWMFNSSSSSGITEADDLLKQINPQGKLGLRLWVEYPNPQGLVQGNMRLDMKDFSLTPPPFPYRLTGINGVVELRTGKDGSLTLLTNVASSATRCSISAKGRILRLDSAKPVWDLSCKAENVSIDSALQHAFLLSTEELLPKIWKGFTPNGGKANLALRLTSPEGGGKPIVSLDLKLNQVGATFNGLPREDGGDPFGFPYPMEEVTGLLQVRPGGLIILNDLVATRGPAKATIGGSIHAVKGAGKGDLHLRIKAENFPLDEELEKSLHVALKDDPTIFADYSPRGSIDGMIQVAREEGETKTQVITRLYPRNASASYEGFPYRVENLQGNILISKLGVSFDLDGGEEDSPIKVHGRFPSRKGGAEKHMELTVTAKNLEINDKLKGGLYGLSPATRETWEAFSPQGSLDLQLAAAGTRGERGPRFDIGVDLIDVCFTYKGFKVPVTDTAGKIYIAAKPGLLTANILGLKGKAYDSPVTIYGALQDIPGGNKSPEMDITVIANRVRVTPELGKVLDEAKLLNRKTFDMLAASGTIDVVQRVARKAGSDDVQVSSEIQLLDITCRSHLLFDTATEVKGTVNMSDEGMEIRWVEGKLGGTPIVITQGSIRSTDKHSVIKARLTSPHFPIDDRLARIMDAPVNRIYLDRQAKAEMVLDPLNLTFTVPQGEGPVMIDFSGSFKVKSGEARLGIPIKGFCGAFTVTKGRLGGGELSAQGNLEGLDMAIMDLPFSGITGQFSLNQDTLCLPEGRADFAGGTLKPFAPDMDFLRLVFAEPNPLTMNMRFQGVDIKKLAANATGPARHFHGTLLGYLRLQMPDQDPRNIKADLEVKTKEAYIGEVPIFADLYRLLAVKETPSFKEGLIKAKAANGQLAFKKISLLSTFFDVTGSGIFSFDRGFNFLFKAGNLGTKILEPFLSYRMQGTLRDYQITVESPLINPLMPASQPPPEGPVFPPLIKLPERPLVVPERKTK